jgi:hypothetical protein
MPAPFFCELSDRIAQTRGDLQRGKGAPCASRAGQAAAARDGVESLSKHTNAKGGTNTMAKKAAKGAKKKGGKKR